MPKSIYNEAIVAGPFSIHFYNRNKEMNLKGHGHFAQVYFEFQTTGSTGFPSFAHTHAEIQRHLISMTQHPFLDCTNEQVLRILFEDFRVIPLRETKQYGGAFELVGMELHVRGVPDDIGHADSFTIYRIRQ